MALDTEIERMRAVEDADNKIVAPASDPVIREVRDRLGNFDSLSGFTATDDTSGSTLASNAVPEGVAVLVQANDANTDPVLLGPAGGPFVVDLAPRESVALNVADTDAIGLQAQTAGDGVGVLYEDA